MNILININLNDEQLQQIKDVSPEVQVIRHSSAGEMLEAMPEVDALFGALSEKMFARADRLKWVQIGSAGVDENLFPEFVESDIVFTSAKGIVGIHLAEHAMALLLGLSRGIATAIRNPNWNQRGPIRNISLEMEGQTVGIVGLGGTGRAVADRAHGFGMKVIAVDPEDIGTHPKVTTCWKMDRFHDMLKQSDVVIICAPLTPETENLFDREAFTRMRNHAILINVTRGKIINEEALMEALRTGTIGGAGLDVTPKEPLPEDHPLWSMPNVIVTPHSAGGSPHRMGRSVDLFCKNLSRLIDGQPLTNVIDKRKGY